IRPEMMTTAKTISKVTMITGVNWNSRHASKYQLVVQPTGSQVPSQRVATELTITAAMTPRRLSRNSATTDQMAKRQRREARPASRIIWLSSSLGAAGGAAIEQIA